MEDEQRRRVLMLALLPVALVLICIAGAVVGMGVRRAPRTHAENIRAALDRHGVAYQSVELSQSFEDSIELDFFRAHVKVRLRDGRVVNGWLGCEDRNSQCFLELRGAGIVGERLPELARDPPWPWLIWVRSALRRIGVGL
ncbi:MAG: hypothetical protein DIU80_019710 [Chloroflexota bacterium]|nr:MAG: hypothetical protein DIU80_16695 [Chloroflexota bacterium]